MLPAAGEDTMPDFEHIRYAVGDGIATLTLHRPERLNAVDAAMLREIVAALDAADGRARVDWSAAWSPRRR